MGALIGEAGYESTDEKWTLRDSIKLSNEKVHLSTTVLERAEKLKNLIDGINEILPSKELYDDGQAIKPIKDIPNLFRDDLETISNQLRSIEECINYVIDKIG